MLPGDLVIPNDKQGLQSLLEERLTSLDGKPTKWGMIREFRLLFESEIGTLADRRNKVYLRPETAQGVFINFKNLIRSLRESLPLTVGQIGKAFRNEITPAHLLFRSREFEQLEYESFISPETADLTFDKHLLLVRSFLDELGFRGGFLREREHTAEELAHYSKRTLDIEYRFPFGWGELLGIANRSDFDLKAHQNNSGEDMSYLDQNGRRFLPHVIETSIGVDRLLLALLIDSFSLRKINGKDCPLLSLDPKIAPYQVAILPLLNRHIDLAFDIYQRLNKTQLRVTFDKGGSIGKRYRRQDAIGTPFAVTVDELSLEEATVTVRLRDSMEQLRERVSISDLGDYLVKLILV